MSVLIIMCGLQYSGKTTIAKIIQKELRAERITVDEVAQELQIDLSAHISEQKWTEIYKIAMKRLEEAIDVCDYVVFDATNLYVNFRKKLRLKAHNKCAHVVTVFIDTPRSIILQRHEKVKGRHCVQTKDLKQLIINMQPPTEEENALVVQKESDVQNIVERIREHK